MDRTTATVAIVSGVVGQVCALLGLWLRLRWRVWHEQAQRQYLASTVETLASGGRLKVDEQKADGHRLRMEISRGPARTPEGEE
ncbi:hypothetical protein [Streptomyces sp. NPDC001621]|uniref:hypothetical protein n=1 Tax=Streptomyces sp. NPDC001621 TaxID=3364594 RepID=UPI0036D1AD9A